MRATLIATEHVTPGSGMDKGEIAFARLPLIWMHTFVEWRRHTRRATQVRGLKPLNRGQTMLDAGGGPYFV